MNHREKFENRHERFLRQMERYERDAEKIAKKAEKHGLGAEAEWLRQSLGITKPIEVTATRKTDPGHISSVNSLFDRQRPDSRSYSKRLVTT